MIRIKKQYGQHFLRDHLYTHHMIDAVELNENTPVFEIGCGDGFLTRDILQNKIARLWVFEIDPEWADYVRESVKDERLEVFEQNFLDLEFSRLEAFAPWTVLANLPYLVTFPILHKFHANRHLIKEGVVMIQEEVAQKLVKTHGRGYGYPSLFFQYYFELRLLDKVPPTAFEPPPKVMSRLIYFKPRAGVKPIPEEEKFWQFIYVCFKQPRRTMFNNLRASKYDVALVDEQTLKLRAQQMSMQNFLDLWEKLRK
jgi:16S rRNA (adenine1518-N6/adenine1519-N6)-dimethyltransferase